MRNLPLVAICGIPLLLAAGLWSPPVGATRFDSARWIDEGLEKERAGDLAGAERDLVTAAEVDKLYEPRWTLAGFYFRRGDGERFWHWAHEALVVGRRDLGALFDLCWQMPDGEKRIWAAMPERKATWDEYLFYLVTAGRWPAAAVTAQRIARAGDASDVPMLVNYCDLAIGHEDRLGAWAVWNTMRQRRLLPFDAGTLLTNGEFQAEPSGRGFDWRVVAAPGLRNAFRAGQMGFTLNGFERERELLLNQPMELESGRPYRLKFEYKSTAPGIRWEAGTDRSAAFPLSDWTAGEFVFSGSARELTLVYEREAGVTIAEGTVAVRNVSAVPE